jgi:hypothetical protein
MFSGKAGGHIDHDHKTGKVRGVLCLNCNTMIGRIETKVSIEDIKIYIGE